MALVQKSSETRFTLWMERGLDMNCTESLKKSDGEQAARNRSARIRDHREEIISRQPKLRIIATRTFIQSGRIVTEYMIDGSREYGGGYGFKLVCGSCA